jgi:hypothetical protein
MSACSADAGYPRHYDAAAKVGAEAARGRERERVLAEMAGDLRASDKA